MKKKMTFKILGVFFLCLTMATAGYWTGHPKVQTASIKNVAGQARAIASDEEIAPPRYFSCADIYALNAEHQMNMRFEVKALSQTLGTGGAFMGLVSVNPAMIIVSVVGGFVGSTVSSLRTKEEKVMLLQEAGTRLSNKLLKQARQIVPEITAENVSSILDEGFTSGYFCADYPKLMNKKKIRDYVLDKVEKGIY